MKIYVDVMIRSQFFLLCQFQKLFSSWSQATDLSKENDLQECNSFTTVKTAAELLFQSHLPMWFVANCSSMLSLESTNGVAMIPALFLTEKEKIEDSIQKMREHHFVLSYMRRFKGRFNDLYAAANFLTDTIELKSNSMASTFAVGLSFTIASLTSLPATMFLTAMITWTPRRARTRAVSVPMPLEAPTGHDSKHISVE